MASINETPVTGRRKPGVRVAKKHSLRIDMTPMVDLGFLLIAFFIMTTEMSKPSVAKLNMPKEDGPSMPIAQSASLTVILGKDRTVYYYHGSWEDAIKNNAVQKTNLSYHDGIGDVIRAKQQQLEASNFTIGTGDKKVVGKETLTLVIKPLDEASYETIVDMLDETMINNVSRYAMVRPAPAEVNYFGR